MIMNKYIIAPTSEMDYCKETNRYYCCLYIAIKKKDFLAYVSCSEFDFVTNQAKDLAIEFLNNYNYNTEKVPYEKELFSQIENISNTMFREVKTNQLNVV